jgi:hypothetical protein
MAAGLCHHFSEIPIEIWSEVSKTNNIVEGQHGRGNMLGKGLSFLAAIYA